MRMSLKELAQKTWSRAAEYANQHPDQLMRWRTDEMIIETMAKFAAERIQANLKAVRGTLVADQATGAGDYTEAEEYADRMMKAAPDWEPR